MVTFNISKDISSLGIWQRHPVFLALFYNCKKSIGQTTALVSARIHQLNILHFQVSSKFHQLTQTKRFSSRFFIWGWVWWVAGIRSSNHHLVSQLLVLSSSLNLSVIAISSNLPSPSQGSNTPLFKMGHHIIMLLLHLLLGSQPI